MWLMLQQDEPDDYVIATGESHSVRELVEIAFAHVGLDWQKYVHQDPAFLRPAEVDHLIGDASKARTKLGWTPEVDFKGLVKMMVDADLERLSDVRTPRPLSAESGRTTQSSGRRFPPYFTVVRTTAQLSKLLVAVLCANTLRCRRPPASASSPAGRTLNWCTGCHRTRPRRGATGRKSRPRGTPVVTQTLGSCRRRYGH